MHLSRLHYNLYVVPSDVYKKERLEKLTVMAVLHTIYLLWKYMYK